MPRPRTPLISRESAVATSLEIIESEGYEQFSVEKVARAMGVKSPSLYHHFGNRSGLLTEVARELLVGVPLDPDPPRTDWQEWFVALSMRTYGLIMQHPRAAGLLFTHFPTTVIMPAHERGAAIMADVGIPPSKRWVAMRGLEKLIFGLAAADADDLVHGRDQLPRDMARDAMPFLVEAVEAGEQNREHLVEQAIRLFLTGVQATLHPAPNLPARKTRRRSS
jgi:AcrR family transcriptional regulator